MLCRELNWVQPGTRQALYPLYDLSGPCKVIFKDDGHVGIVFEMLTSLTHCLLFMRFGDECNEVWVVRFKKLHVGKEEKKPIVILSLCSKFWAQRSSLFLSILGKSFSSRFPAERNLRKELEIEGPKR